MVDKAPIALEILEVKIDLAMAQSACIHGSPSFHTYLFQQYQAWYQRTEEE